MPVRADDMSAEMILNDPEAPVGGNPNGDLTIVSFIDYNCPFCKRTVEPLNTVLERQCRVTSTRTGSILAQSSVYGAKLALAAGYQNRYEEAYLALMGIEGSRVPEEQMRQALKVPASTRRVSRPKPTAATPRSPPCLQRTTQAEGLGLRGTPVFLIGRFSPSTRTASARLSQTLAKLPDVSRSRSSE